MLLHLGRVSREDRIGGFSLNSTTHAGGENVVGQSPLGLEPPGEGSRAKPEAKLDRERPEPQQGKHDERPPYALHNGERVSDES